MISPELIDIQDTVRIIILHVMSFILFVSSSEVARVWMFRVCEDIGALGTYNWGQAVLDYLMKYVNTKDAEDVRGCTTFIQVSLRCHFHSYHTYYRLLVLTNFFPPKFVQYWFCERIKLIQPSHPEALPRYRKWDLSRLKSGLVKGISNLEGHKVKSHPITPRQNGTHGTECSFSKK